MNRWKLPFVGFLPPNELRHQEGEVYLIHAVLINYIHVRIQITDSVAVAIAIAFLLPFSAQKSHVKPLNLSKNQPTHT